MSEYLSAIAARSTDTMSALLPNVQAGHEPTGHSPFEDTLAATEATALSSETERNTAQPVVHTTTDIQPVTIQPSIQPVYRTEKTDAEKDDTIPYMTGLVDRLVVHENNLRERVVHTSAHGTQTNAHHTTVQIENIVPVPTEKSIKTEDTGEAADFGLIPAETGKVESSTITPSFKGVQQPPADRIRILPRLVPEVLQPVHAAAVNNGTAGMLQKPNAAPKLVIGKITVEVVPPAAPVPQKIITRTVQTSSSASQPKNNRLSFGLGQL